jgi:AcrR family transcriptional regulator
MARPLSDEKREAILASAIELVAALGTGAPTAKIAHGAGVAEGTLFKYFASKDELLNQLYLKLKGDFARVMLDAYPADAGMRERCWHIWNAVIDWGSTTPTGRKALRQLGVSEKVTPATRQQAAAAFRHSSATLDQILSGGERFKGQPPGFAGALFEAITETTLEFIARNPGHRDAYKRAGFDVFWNGVVA